MGFLDSWIDNRRKNELDHVNHELEELKRHGPQAAHQQSPRVSPPTNGLSKQHIVVMGIICIALVVGVYLFSQQRAEALQQQLTEKDVTLVHLQGQLANFTVEIQTLNKELETRDESQSELSSDHTQLRLDFAALQLTVSAMNNTIDDQKTEVASLEKQLAEKEKTLDEIKNCIESNNVTDKEDCI